MPQQSIRANNPSPQGPHFHYMTHLYPSLPHVETSASRCSALLRYNAVQRTLSAMVLAPLVTVFIWVSPAIATSIVCSFMTSTCSYEYACLANRIRLRLLARLRAFEQGERVTQTALSLTSQQHTRSDSRRSSSSFDCDNFGLKMMAASQAYQIMSFHGDQMTRSFQEEQEAIELALVNHELRQEALRLERCAISSVAKYAFEGREWLAAVCLSPLLCAISCLVFLLVMQGLPELKSTEFYEARWFYIIGTGFVAAMCACLSPDWRYAVIVFLENAIFTILTLLSTACPMNEFSCNTAIQSSHILLGGMVLVLVFRLTTCQSNLEAFVTFTLDALGLIYIIGTLSVLVAFVDDGHRILYRKLLIALLSVVWASDTGAYITGKVLTLANYPYYNPLVAHLSKNKDYEGTIGAIAFGIVAMVVSSHLLDLPGSFVTKVTLTVIAVIIGRLGDLFESLLKRAAGVKDSGTLIPGHGGVLDRIDALMFATLVFSRYYAMIF